ncbi:hypothetical protein [Corynebacterium epidermidicanis]|uniref:Or membrane protein n=1 Tax=Corynebacterium epidermidicanis TaxID=1050174 RepID=A0A0G3GLJ3_9CORY|nr:hypothetical protein [Corynebacterium epidermidicanis]AKK02039.1 hypothetical protein CEPID_00725 [Corynebacterium epidermidicanis]MDU0479754.1 hypothetical protein [Staphylococcus chromogenes]
MRNFKNIAVASATAIALTISGSAVAHAGDVNVPEKVATSSGSSVFGDWLNADKDSTGEVIFGENKDKVEAPAWGEAWVGGLWALGAITVAGIINAAFNWAKHEGFII